jgi:hypothetical protein
MELLSPPTTFDVQTAAAFINAMTFDSAHIDTTWDDRRKVHLTTSNLFPVAWLYKNHPLRCSNCDKNWKPSNHKRWQNLQDDRDVIFVLLRNGTFEATKHDPEDLDPYNSEVVCQERTKNERFFAPIRQRRVSDQLSQYTKQVGKYIAKIADELVKSLTLLTNSFAPEEFESIESDITLRQTRSIPDFTGKEQMSSEERTNPYPTPVGTVGRTFRTASVTEPPEGQNSSASSDGTQPLPVSTWHSPFDPPAGLDDPDSDFNSTMAEQIYHWFEPNARLQYYPEKVTDPESNGLGTVTLRDRLVPWDSIHPVYLPNSTGTEKHKRGFAAILPFVPLVLKGFIGLTKHLVGKSRRKVTKTMINELYAKAALQAHATASLRVGQAELADEVHQLHQEYHASMTGWNNTFSQMIATLSMKTRAEQIQSRAKADLDLLRSLLSEVKHGRTPARFLSDASLFRLFVKIRRTHNLDLDLDWSHTHSGLYATADSLNKTAFLVITSFPAYNEVEEVYEVIPIPFMQDGKMIIPILNYTFFSISEDESRYTIMSKDDVVKCAKGVCPLINPTHETSSGECGASLMDGHDIKKCPTAVFGDPYFLYPTEHGIIYSVRTPETVVLDCPDHANHTGNERGKIESAGFLGIPAGCTLRLPLHDIEFFGPVKMLGIPAENLAMKNSVEEAPRPATKFMNSMHLLTRDKLHSVATRSIFTAWMLRMLALGVVVILSVLICLISCYGLRLYCYTTRTKRILSYWIYSLNPKIDPTKAKEFTLEKPAASFGQKCSKLCHPFVPQRSRRSVPDPEPYVYTQETENQRLLALEYFSAKEKEREANAATVAAVAASAPPTPARPANVSGRTRPKVAPRPFKFTGKFDPHDHAARSNLHHNALHGSYRTADELDADRSPALYPDLPHYSSGEDVPVAMSKL